MLNAESYQYFMQLYITDLFPINYIKYTDLSRLKCVSKIFNDILNSKTDIKNIPSKLKISNYFFGNSEKNKYNLYVGTELIKDLFTQSLETNEKFYQTECTNNELDIQYSHECMEIMVYKNYIKNLFQSKPLNQLNSCYKIITDIWKQDIGPFLEQFHHDPIISDSEPVIIYEKIQLKHPILL